MGWHVENISFSTTVWYDTVSTIIDSRSLAIYGTMSLNIFFMQISSKRTAIINHNYYYGGAVLGVRGGGANGEDGKKANNICKFQHNSIATKSHYYNSLLLQYHDQQA